MMERSLKQRLRTAALGLAVCALVPATPAAAQEMSDTAGQMHTPGDIGKLLSSIYGRYSDDGSGLDWSRPHRVFETQLADSIAMEVERAESSQSAINLSDPFCGCQDWYGMEWRTLLVDMQANSATAFVETNLFGRAMVRRLDLVRTTTGWRVADIRPINSGYSFREETFALEDAGD